MWFKNALVYQMEGFNDNVDLLIEKLTPLSFSPCLPSLPYSAGWVPPIDQEGMELVYSVSSYHMLCLQLEEKILPSMVVRQELLEKVKEIEKRDGRKISYREKQALKDDLTQTLLMKAFCKRSKVYGYFDQKNKWLVLDASTNFKVEKFLSMLGKALPAVNFHLIETKKVNSVLTNWMTHQNYPATIAINESCVLADPSQTARTIRTRKQDLFASSMQMLLKESYEVKQLALTWNDQVDFTLSEDFILRSMRFSEEIIDKSKEDYAETEAQQFDADFIIMTELLSTLLTELIDLFAATQSQAETEKESSVAAAESESESQVDVAETESQTVAAEV